MGRMNYLNGTFFLSMPKKIIECVKPMLLGSLLLLLAIENCKLGFTLRVCREINAITHVP